MNIFYKCLGTISKIHKLKILLFQSKMFRRASNSATKRMPVSFQFTADL